MAVSSVLVTPSATLPVDLDEAKAQLQVSGTTDDALITRLIKVAALHIEEHCNIALLTQTRRLTLDCFPAVIRLDRPKLIAVTSLAYINTAGVSTTLDASKYSVDTDSRPGRNEPAYNQTWPATRNEQNAVTITYTAGFGDSQSDIPLDIQHAIILLAQKEYEGCAGDEATQRAIDSLLSSYAMTEYV